ncbi:hypothetical protein GCM10010975_07070 [Comamonas phosphati]|nr:hypothetical protein GCM10010975_07070 [Comamonas phosphati]
MKKSSNTALLPFEAEDAAALLASKIRIARIARGWTQAELAARSDLSTRTVTSIEAGAVNVQLGFWLKALWALDLLHDFIAHIQPVGMNDHEFALLAANAPKRVREKGSAA